MRTFIKIIKTEEPSPCLHQAYVKARHTTGVGGNQRKFNVATSEEATKILREAINKGNVLKIQSGVSSAQGNPTYNYWIDAGKVIGTRGETVIKIVLASDGGMLTAYPVPWP